MANVKYIQKEHYVLQVDLCTVKNILSRLSFMSSVLITWTVQI